MVKVLLTGSQHLTAPSGQVAVERLHGISEAKGTYKAATVAETPADIAVFTNRKQIEQSKSSNNIFQKAGEHLPKASLLLAGTVLGGILGGLFPGAFIGGISAVGIMG